MLETLLPESRYGSLKNSIYIIARILCRFTMSTEEQQQENLIKRIDSIVRSLSQSKSETRVPEGIQKIRDDVEQDDRPRLAALLEDILVLLKDDPQNTVRIKEKLNRIWDGYGHIKPLSEIIDQIKKYYLSSNTK